MGVPGADDVMLNYQSTSFHDALYLRNVLGLKREAIRNETFRARLTALRAKLVPRARAAGWLTKDDIFREVS